MKQSNPEWYDDPEWYNLIQTATINQDIIIPEWDDNLEYGNPELYDSN